MPIAATSICISYASIVPVRSGLVTVNLLLPVNYDHMLMILRLYPVIMTIALGATSGTGRGTDLCVWLLQDGKAPRAPLRK